MHVIHSMYVQETSIRMFLLGVCLVYFVAFHDGKTQKVLHKYLKAKPPSSPDLYTYDDEGAEPHPPRANLRPVIFFKSFNIVNQRK